MSQTPSGNINSFNISNNFTVVDQRSEILAWLSPLEPRIRHQDIRTRRVDGVGNWLLQTDQFRSWCDVTSQDELDKTVLSCYGNPGVGKTYMSSLVIDTLCDRARRQNVAVACFYCDFPARKEQSPTSMLGALLRQVVGGLKEIPGGIMQAFEDQKHVIGGRGLRLPEIIKMLQTISSSRRTFICVDALDELVPEYRVKLLGSLRDILQKSPGTRVFLTGRSHIRSEIERRLGGRTSSLSISPNEGDIITYIHARLEEDTTPEAMDDSLEADILGSIPESVSEIFLLVSLRIEEILRETTIYRRRKKLSAIADTLGLGDAYSATLERIKAQSREKSRLGMAALMWISHSQRPLRVDELCHALAVEMGSTDLDADNVPLVMTVLGSCQGLIVLDKESSTVRLIHFTLQEYLSSCPELFGSAHSTITEICLTYLNSRQVKALSLEASHHPDTPLLEYSSTYWGTHARMGLSDCAKSLALDLFSQYDKHVSVKILLEKLEPTLNLKNEQLLFTGLHCASFFGIVEIVTTLIETKGCDINQGDFTGATPLTWAAWSGHEGVAKLLLEREDVSPDEPDEEGRTPLAWAARKGHEGVVKLLLRREDVNPDIPDKYYGQTPLSWAAERGHEEVVKLLLERGDVTPDKPDEEGRTALSWAAENGHEEIVKLILGREDINPDRPDEEDWTPLLRAARKGHEEVAKLLMERGDVNPDKPDEGGRTPLSWAAQNGNDGVVKLLLERKDVNPNGPDQEGRTPLLWAAQKGREGAVELLLSQGDVNPNNPDRKGQTPLLWAARNGHVGVVKLLLERGDANPDKPDNRGRTAFAWATAEKHSRVLDLLRA